jgi:nicotinamide riboside kinase
LAILPATSEPGSRRPGARVPTGTAPLTTQEYRVVQQSYPKKRPIAVRCPTPVAFDVTVCSPRKVTFSDDTHRCRNEKRAGQGGTCPCG